MFTPTPRVQVPSVAAKGEIFQVKALISHQMETGLRRDPQGDVIPRNIINRGESFLKLTRNGTNFTMASWFTPYNYQTLNDGDLDLGSAGLLLRLP